MKLHLERITKENREKALALRLAPGQEGFIETIQECLEEADGLSLWNPVGIVLGEDWIGFAMYGQFPREGESGRVWLDRFLIDRRWQGKGYGRAALHLLLNELIQKYGREEIYLSLYEDNEGALSLYQKTGFDWTGERDIHGERVMARVGPPPPLPGFDNLMP